MKTAIAATLFLALSLTACDEDDPAEDTPAVCDSVDDLQASVNDVKEIDVTDSGGLSDLESGLADVESSLADVKSDAASEFSAPLDAVQASFDALQTSVEAAVSAASAATLKAAASALSTFGTEVEGLINDIQSTC